MLSSSVGFLWEGTLVIHLPKALTLEVDREELKDTNKQVSFCAAPTCFSRLTSAFICMRGKKRDLHQATKKSGAMESLACGKVTPWA